MKRYQAHLRLIGTVAAVCGWLLLATHFCVDIGSTHTELVPHAAHSDAAPHDADPIGHSACLLILRGNPDRDPANPPMETETFAGPGKAILLGDMPAEHAVVLLPADAGRARSAPLYLLHAAFLI